jgi:hypothetical protein
MTLGFMPWMHFFIFENAPLSIAPLNPSSGCPGRGDRDDDFSNLHHQALMLLVLPFWMEGAVAGAASLIGCMTWKPRGSLGYALLFRGLLSAMRRTGAIAGSAGMRLVVVTAVGSVTRM